MEAAVRRFACTQCGKCCNRSPEVELSEAAALADVFVFRLMFRLHRWPSALRDWVGDGTPTSSGEVFFQTKRMLGAHAARKSKTKVVHGTRAVEYDQYLFISALSLDANSGACSALHDGRCSIYERRPFTCRTVPLQYWRVDAALPRQFDAFVDTPGYACDTSESAPAVLNGGRIVDDELQRSRTDALAMSEQDSSWRQAILRRLKSGKDGLPTLREIDASASFAAVTVSMRLAWEIGAEVGLLSAKECRTIAGMQTKLIDRELSSQRWSGDARQTLLEMQDEYRRAPNS